MKCIENWSGTRCLELGGGLDSNALHLVQACSCIGTVVRTRFFSTHFFSMTKIIKKTLSFFFYQLSASNYIDYCNVVLSKQ